MNNITRIIATITLFFLCCNTNAQSGEADSLTKILSTNIADSVRVDVLNALSKSYFNANPDTSVTIATSSKLLAEKIDYKPGLALALKNMGIGYYLQGIYIDAVKTWQEALDVYKIIGDKAGVANMLSNQGAVYFNKGDDAKSLELHLESLRISEEINDTLRVLTSLNNIGAVYLNKSATYQKALDYFLQSYKLSHAIKDQYLIGTSAANLGEIYYKMGDDSTALIYLNESADAYEGTEDLPYALNYIGRIYTRKQEYEKAIKYHKRAFQIAKNLNTSLDMTQSLVGLAQGYYARGDIDSSINSYKQALQIGEPLNALYEIKEAYEGLSNAYSEKSDFVNAFRYQNQLLAIKDSIYNIETDKKLESLSFAFDLEKKQSQIDLLNKEQEVQDQVIRRQKFVRNSFIAGFVVVLLFAGVFFRQRNKISKEKHRSEELLLNILPAQTAEELKHTGKAQTRSFESITVLFTDFKNFTRASEELTPEELVEEINHCYSEFDRIISKYRLEKIKTIGDSYMCAGGLPVANDTHPVDIVSAGLEMIAFIEKNKADRIQKGKQYFELRVGANTGPVVAGIVGIKKFAYDIWGDTVNTASRMESSGEIGKMNISGNTYELVKDKFKCIYRGKVEAKNKGLIDMYFVQGRIEA
ncbi:MAG TPA: adenylate/guanylate cyclase domain-containing protein [Chitinophagaceae bacterium]|nr:adenylate/guanylate cyclase domain-containing protein [Chitinophagaceae bacterium]